MPIFSRTLTILKKKQYVVVLMRPFKQKSQFNQGLRLVKNVFKWNGKIHIQQIKGEYSKFVHGILTVFDCFFKYLSNKIKFENFTLTKHEFQRKVPQKQVYVFITLLLKDKKSSQMFTSDCYSQFGVAVCVHTPSTLLSIEEKVECANK